MSGEPTTVPGSAHYRNGGAVRVFKLPLYTVFVVVGIFILLYMFVMLLLDRRQAAMPDFTRQRE